MDAAASTTHLTRDQGPFGRARAMLALYFRLIGAQFRAQLQYRASFALQVLGQALATSIDFVAIAMLLSQFRALGGWSLSEVAVLYGLGGVAFGCSDLVCGGFDRLGPDIQSGTFDRVLTRPLGAFFQTAVAEVQLRRIGRVSQAAVVLLGAFALAGIDWTADKVVMVVLVIASGTVIYSSVFVIGAAVTFWTIQTSEVTNVFTYGGSAVATYPMSVYDDWLRRFFTFVVPVAFVAYVPALYLLGRPELASLPPGTPFLSPAIAAAFFVVARLTWAIGVRHYRSTGS